MSFTTMAVTPRVGAPAAEVSIALSAGKKGPTIYVSIPTTFSTRLKVDAEPKVMVGWGEDEDSGKLMVRADPGGYELHFLKTHMRLRIPAPAQVENVDREKERVPHYWEGDALILAMPLWAWQSELEINRNKLDVDGEGRPTVLRIEGTTLIVDDWSARYTKKEAAFLELFIQRYGRVLTKEQIHEHVYSMDNDPADIKIVDVVIYKLRKSLAGSGLLISTHWGVGYALVRDKGQPQITKLNDGASRQQPGQKAAEKPRPAIAIAGDYVTIGTTPVKIAAPSVMALFQRLNKDFGSVVPRTELHAKWADIDRQILSLKAKLENTSIRVASTDKGWKLEEIAQ